MKDVIKENTAEPGLTLTDLYDSGLKKLFTGLLPMKDLDDYFRIPALKVLCLTGKPGVGKRSLARGFAGSAAQAGYCYRHVSENMLCEIPRKEREACFGNILLEAAKTPCVLMLEPQGKKYFWKAAAALLPALPKETPFITIFIEDETEMVCPQGLPDLMTFLVEPPDQKAREAFFSDAANALMRATNDKGEKTPSYVFLACETEGLTYTELKQVVFMIRFQLKQRALSEFDVPEDEIKDKVTGAYKEGKFFYTKEMFLEAVRSVRAMKAEIKKRTNTSGLAAPAAPAAEMDTKPASAAAASQPLGQETPKKPVIPGLRIPPDPRNK